MVLCFISLSFVTKLLNIQVSRTYIVRARFSLRTHLTTLVVALVPVLSSSQELQQPLPWYEQIIIKTQDFYFSM